VSEDRAGLPILTFANAAAWETWLASQPRDCKGVWLKLARKGSGTPSVTKAEAIDGALCHGWIDGQLQPYDDRAWLVRFTPRASRSKWSENNRRRALELIAEGRVRRAGLAEIEAAKADGRWDRAYAPQSTAEMPPDLKAALDAAPTALKLFDALDSANRYAILYRIHEAKRPETRAARIETFVEMLTRGQTVHPRRGRT
jgi:uncharacterized protein YdeI (YjbR/CyaY-like superfamily)